MMRPRPLVLLSILGLVSACAIGGDDSAEQGSAVNTPDYNELNLAAGSQILYEVQVRTANACHPDVGTPEQRSACVGKPAPKPVYRAEGMSCPEIDSLNKIRLGTLDDLMGDSADYRKAITLRYIKERVGATTVWLMPLFPNNDTWTIPDRCDNLGSPYAVRDYFHAGGTLSRACNARGLDDRSPTPCWANTELDATIAQAHARGLKVFLDVALNHFGHNYAMYDVGSHRSVPARVRDREDLNRLWDFGATHDEGLVHPEVVDTPDKLNALAGNDRAASAELSSLKAKCPKLSGDLLVRAFHAWRNAFDFERAGFPCDAEYLESQVPAFYLGRDSFNPSTRMGDNFTNDWRDVKFLYHHEENGAHSWEFVREREYLFRIMNYWVSRGVDGFRLDHTTDWNSGMGSNEWKYLTSKVDYYAWKRGQARPVFLAEEFGDQMEMNKVVDVMTDGYVGDMNGRNGITKDTYHVQRVLSNMGRFNGHAFVMTALETHDEHRLTDGTGFDQWTGAGFWGIGATTRSTPMMLMGQELGEPRSLGFRKSDFIRSRFDGNDHDPLVGYYKAMSTGRLRQENRALLAPNYAFLRSKFTNQADTRIFAQVKWSDDGNAVFVFHNLWNQDVTQTFFVDGWAADRFHLRDDLRYRVVDILSGQQMGGCRSGWQVKNEFFVQMGAATRAQWLRLEMCQ